MQIHTKVCVMTGCSVIIHDNDKRALIHGDLYVEINNVTGGHFLWLGGIHRAKDGKMHCTTLPKEDLPAHDVDVVGGIVAMPISDSGYGQVTFAQGTLIFGEKVLWLLGRSVTPESYNRVTSMYEMEISRLTN